MSSLSVKQHLDLEDAVSDSGKSESLYGSEADGKSGDESSDSKLNLAKKETKAVFRLRLLVFIVLLMAAVAVSVIVYFVTFNAEQEEYKTQFEGTGKKVIETFLGIVTTKFGALSTLGVQVTGQGIDNGSEWPFVTLSNFQQRATTARQLSGAVYVQLNPFISSDNKEAWEDYCVGPASEWIDEGIEYQKSIGLFDYAPASMNLNAERNLPDEWPIYARNSSNVPNPDVSGGPYMVSWQQSPVMDGGTKMNENLLNAYAGVPLNMSFHNQTVVLNNFFMGIPGDIYSESSLAVFVATMLSTHVGENVFYAGDPIGQLYIPIFDTFGDNRKTVSTIVAWVHWGSFFRGILPENVKGVNFVLNDNCGGTYTYEIYGEEVRPIGKGDLHDPKFESMKMTSSFDSIETIADGTKNGLPFSREYCTVSLDVYPTQVFFETYNTKTPILMTLAVAFIFVFTALMFLFYDRLVERRQQLVMDKALRTNAIVSSLFPEQVRERLMQQSGSEKGKDGSASFVAPNRRLKGYLDGDKEDDTNGSPIADLFPHCTVLFADIAGFTAWSSTREPAQVFILLQTVYQAFDKIAKRRKVFKVETIGDSYVAITGCPEPQTNHAVIMAKFAAECQCKMNELTAQLEETLGPDTGDLAMRFGMHSGPVTAGVLRGDRARFQLFGDTVNTAARMESTGVKNKIQISQSTYEVLVKSGKQSWVKPRKEKVHAKGKGDLQTYWCSPTSSSKKGSSTGDSVVSGGSSEENTSDPSPAKLATLKKIKQKASELKEERLVGWIVDTLQEHIRKLVALRESNASKAVKYKPNKNLMPLDEVAEVIYLPSFCESAFAQANDFRNIELDSVVMSQLRDYVTTIASWYRDNPFHNFEHACHVTMSTNKFLKRIVAPDIAVNEAKNCDIASELHNYTLGINSDPLTLFGVVFSALIHDVDHRGVSNAQLIKEEKEMGEKYNQKSVAEQNSLDIAWNHLMKDQFKALRACLFTTEEELQRFRQVLVNVVLATDIFDPELNGLRKKRWEKAFSEDSPVSDEENTNRRATIVIEHIIQASDVSHTMQHWHIYRKWNEKLFEELYLAYLDGRMAKDPSEFWYQGELGFFDNYVIPLAKKLKDCRVFGVSSDECLNYAENNRKEWASRGLEIVEELKREMEGKAKAIPEEVEEEEEVSQESSNGIVTTGTADSSHAFEIEC